MTIDKEIYSREEAIDDVLSGNRNLYAANGMTPEYLAKKHKKELNAVKPTRLKVKGAVTPELTKAGKPKKNTPKIIATSGVIERDADGSVDYGDGETVMEFRDADLNLRQKARMDAQKMLGLYPIERKDVNVTGLSDIMRAVLEEVDGSNRGKLPCEDEY